MMEGDRYKRCLHCNLLSNVSKRNKRFCSTCGGPLDSTILIEAVIDYAATSNGPVLVAQPTRRAESGTDGA